MPDRKHYPNDNARLRFIAAQLRRPDRGLEPSGNVPFGDAHEWDNSVYMQLCANSQCYFCDDWTYNYMTRLDETRNFHPDNLVSECAECRRIRGERTLQEYKTLAEGAESGRP